MDKLAVATIVCQLVAASITLGLVYRANVRVLQSRQAANHKLFDQILAATDEVLPGWIEERVKQLNTRLPSDDYQDIRLAIEGIVHTRYVHIITEMKRLHPEATRLPGQDLEYSEAFICAFNQRSACNHFLVEIEHQPPVVIRAKIGELYAHLSRLEYTPEA